MITRNKSFIKLLLAPNYLELFEFFFAGLELPAPRTMDFLPPKFYFVVTDERLENSLAGIADNS